MAKSTFLSFVLVTGLISILNTVKSEVTYGKSCSSNLECGNTLSCVRNTCSCLDITEIWHVEQNECISSNVRSMTPRSMNIDSMLGLSDDTFITYGQTSPNIADISKRRVSNLLTILNKQTNLSHFNLVALPDGKYASTLGYEVYIWNASDLTILLKTEASFNRAPNAGPLALLANGDLACAKGRTIYILDAKVLTVKRSFSGAANEVRSIVALPDGNLATEGIEESLLIWDIVRGTVKQQVDQCTGCQPIALAYLTNDKLAMTTLNSINIYKFSQIGLLTFEYSITGNYTNVVALKKGYFGVKSISIINSYEYLNVFSSMRDDVRFRIGSSLISRCMIALPDSDISIGYDNSVAIWKISDLIDNDALLTTVKTTSLVSNSTPNPGSISSSMLPEETTTTTKVAITSKNTQNCILSNRIVVWFNLILAIIFFWCNQLS